MKHCTKCGELKPLSDYYSDKRRSDGKRSKCKKCYIGMTNKYRKDNYDKVRAYHAKRYQENKEHIRNIQKDYESRMRKSNTEWKIKKNLRVRLYCALKNNQKKGSAIKELGCSVEFLKGYLSSMFKDGMTWDNYGEWHIDHIKPLSLFDLTDKKQFKIACHYTNLQPLWAEENFKKSNYYDGDL